MSKIVLKLEEKRFLRYVIILQLKFQMGKIPSFCFVMFSLFQNCGVI